MSGFTMLDLVLQTPQNGYAKGHENREAILRAALNVLVNEGYSAMTMRRVAKECGLKFGNLTYYYRSHEDMVHALLEAVVAGYEVRFDEILRDQVEDPAKQLIRYCQFVLEDIQTRETTHLFPEIWALSNHSAFIRNRMEELYRRARAPLLAILQSLRPDLTETARQNLALYISASMEGMTMFVGHEKSFSDQIQPLINLNIAGFLAVIKNA
jgi:AcrR family transcriptional regulator